MTKNKDQKRLVRNRMKKTGESYTAARAVLVARKQKQDESAKYAAPRKDWPGLAGMSDEKIKAATGRTWAQWVDVLDSARAHEWSHTEIAKYIRRKWPKISGWWCQTVTVGYERIRGLRDVGQRCDGDYGASKSCTVPVPIAKLYQMFSDARKRKLWLPDGLKNVRTATKEKSMRVDWHDGTRVEFYFLPKGPAKSTVAVQHVKLSSKADVSRAKVFWAERLAALKDVLS